MYNSLLKWLSKYGVEYFLSNILVSLRIHLLKLRQNAGGDKFPIFNGTDSDIFLASKISKS